MQDCFTIDEARVVASRIWHAVAHQNACHDVVALIQQQSDCLGSSYRLTIARVRDDASIIVVAMPSDVVARHLLTQTIHWCADVIRARHRGALWVDVVCTDAMATMTPVRADGDPLYALVDVVRDTAFFAVLLMATLFGDWRRSDVIYARAPELHHVPLATALARDHDFRWTSAGCAVCKMVFRDEITRTSN